MKQAMFLGSVTIYLDADGDGYGVGQGITVCNSLTGYAQQAGDCDDDDPGIFPLADELCNGLDDDCDNLTLMKIHPMETSGFQTQMEMATVQLLALFEPAKSHRVMSPMAMIVMTMQPQPDN